MLIDIGSKNLVGSVIKNMHEHQKQDFSNQMLAKTETSNQQLVTSNQ